MLRSLLVLLIGQRFIAQVQKGLLLHDRDRERVGKRGRVSVCEREKASRDDTSCLVL